MVGTETWRDALGWIGALPLYCRQMREALADGCYQGTQRAGYWYVLTTWWRWRPGRHG